jgi:hypothetical protein
LSPEQFEQLIENANASSHWGFRPHSLPGR